jgi:DNA-binding transcriptional regulator YiaG
MAAKKAVARHSAAWFRAHCGACIRRWREAHDLSQEQLAASLGVTTKTVARWEHGKPGLRVVHLEQMEAMKPGLVAEVFAVR